MNKKNKKAGLSPEAKKVLDHLNKKGTATVPDLAKMLDKSELGIVELLTELRNANYDIFHDRTSKIVKSVQTIKQSEDEKEPLNISPSISIKKGYRVAIISDTRIGHRNQQLKLLTSAYKIFDKIGVNFTLHAGNLVAGEQPKKHKEENFLQSKEEQLEYVIKHYPKSKNFKTYIIAGQTDLSFKETGNIIRAICEEREDLIYRGDELATFVVGQTFREELIHPSTDNVPYAKTHGFQRILEQIIATIDSLKEQKEIPNTVFAGGYHTPGLLPAYGDIDGFLLPSFITKTPRQKRKGVTPTIGFWIIDLTFDEKIKQMMPKPTLYDWSPYAIKDDYLNDTDAKTFSTYAKDEKSVLETLVDGPQSVGELSRRLNRNKDTINKIINKLTDNKGLIINIPQDTKQVTWNRSFKNHFSSLDDEIMKNMLVNKLKVAVVSDTHLCSNDQQLSMLKRSYEIGDEEKVDVFLHIGDVSDGAGSVGYRSHGKDVFIYGYTDQLDYMVKVYPKSKTGKKTLMIPGNHDWWDYESFGGNIVKELCDRRPDLEYKDYPKANIDLNNFKIQIFHPGGGSSQALSYGMQRHILNQRRNKEEKVDAIFFGNWHKALYLLYAGVHAFLCPSMKGQDEFHQKLSLPNARGMWIVEMWKDKDGRVTKIVPDYRDFTLMTKEKDYGMENMENESNKNTEKEK